MKKAKKKVGLAHKLDKTMNLAYCDVCGAGEGELLKWCPGYKLTTEAREACYQGNVVDLDYYRSKREYEERDCVTER